MGVANQEAIKQFHSLMDQIDEPMKDTFQNMHQGYPHETLVRFLKARDWNVAKAHKMLIECLQWRIQNEIDQILANLAMKLCERGATLKLAKGTNYWTTPWPHIRNLLYSFLGCPYSFLQHCTVICDDRKQKPIIPADLYRAIRDSHLIGLSGYSKEGLPVIAIGVGLSTLDKASVHYYVQSHIQMNEYRDRVILPSATKKYGRHISTCIKVLDMTGLKLSALNQIKLLTVISTVDDLNYPEKTETYYIVNAPYIFSACWKVAKPLLQERTRRKIQVLQGCGRDELLKIVDYSSLPHFCRKEGSGSSHRTGNGTGASCYSLDHDFHQQVYNYIKQQAALVESIAPIKQGSIHVDIPEPDPEDAKIAKTIESEFQKFGDVNGISNSLNGLKVNH